MKLRNWLVAIFLLLLMTGPVNADTRDEVLVMLNYYADMWNQGDVDALQGYYHQDFVLVTDKGIVQRDQLIDDYRHSRPVRRTAGKAGFFTARSPFTE